MSEHPIVTLVRESLADPARPFCIIAELEAQAGKGDAVAAAIQETRAVALTRAEPGCVTYEIARGTSAPDRFVAFECWRDLAALEAHLLTPHFHAVGAALGGLLAGAPAVRILTPSHDLTPA